MISQNKFGKQQLDIDLKADDIIAKHLKQSGVVYAAISEEHPEQNVLNADGAYTVTYDPIDGSGGIEANYSVSSVFAVWKNKDINGSKGKWNAAKKYFREAKKLKITESQIKDQLSMFERALANSGQVKAARSMGNQGMQMMQGGGKSKRRRPKMRQV